MNTITNFQFLVKEFEEQLNRNLKQQEKDFLFWVYLKYLEENEFDQYQVN
ncbi:hypothetical protein GWK91_11960 [Virgibacillus sp. MSP4-1]|uniref:Uncharacterized protein n=1 Tax=Salinibacillus aidingensis TaxID=237684 RepID=A0ABP3KVF8_9BACI|nr:hypothetical protein [Virgibacillus sp. MSP4-1]QHS23625.1 hypothetical protein GWK91_11960 [Virgibacillus sp. MSP4-1]